LLICHVVKNTLLRLLFRRFCPLGSETDSELKEMKVELTQMQLEIEAKDIGITVKGKIIYEVKQV